VTSVAVVQEQMRDSQQIAAAGAFVFDFRSEGLEAGSILFNGSVSSVVKSVDRFRIPCKMS
jgi:hypothetical protein